MPSTKALKLARPARKPFKAIRVRLDPRTVIILPGLEKLAFWKQRYPDARVIG